MLYFVPLCLMKNCPIYAAFFSADKKSTTESTTEILQDRQSIRKETRTRRGSIFLPKQAPFADSYKARLIKRLPF